jgi:hypothetical protein
MAWLVGRKAQDGGAQATGLRVGPLALPALLLLPLRIFTAAL